MSSTASAVSPAPTTFVNPKTPWTQYYCNATTPCPVAGTTCHYNMYCIPELAPGETCKDAKDDVMVPFVARVDDIYTLYCDMPNDIKAQTTKCPLGCESKSFYLFHPPYLQPKQKKKKRIGPQLHTENLQFIPPILFFFFLLQAGSLATVISATSRSAPRIRLPARMASWICAWV